MTSRNPAVASEPPSDSPPPMYPMFSSQAKPAAVIPA